jgi:MFS family permease
VLQVSTGNHQVRMGTLSPSVLLRMGALLLAALSIAVNFTSYGPLIPLLQSALHISSGQAGLFSTLLYAGIACSYLPGGMLADRYGSRRVLIGSLLLIGLGGCLFPLAENLAWMLLCRAIIGLGSGAAIVAGSQAAARLGEYAALGQGLYGGAMQVGAGLGLFLTPQLQALAHLSWQQTFECWGVFALLVCLLWQVALAEEKDGPQPPPVRHLLAGVRQPAIWCLGLVHLGTLGIGQAIAPWLALYFARMGGLPVPLAATFGSIGLFAGMFFRPLGGALLTRRVFNATELLRVGTIFTCAGAGLLALSIRFVPLVGVGIALLSFGTTFPYAAVLSEAGRVGQASRVGMGTAQGMVSVLSAPASALGPSLIGLLLVQGGFSSAFGALAFIGLFPIAAALLAGPLLRSLSLPLSAGARSGQHEPAKQPAGPAGEDRPFVRSRRGQDRQLQERIARLADRQKPQLSATARPLIAVFDPSLPARGQQQHTGKADSPVAKHLLEAGGLPVLLPVPAPGLQADADDVAVDEELFQRTFEQVIWPLFSDLLFHRVSGFYLSSSLEEYRSYPHNAYHRTVERRSVSAPLEEQWSEQIARAIALLARLVGMQVLEGVAQPPPLQVQGRKDQPVAAETKGMKQQGESSLPIVSPSAVAAFVTACSACTPPLLESLQPLQAEICRWLYQREQEHLWQGRSAQARTSQKAGGQTGRSNVPAESLQAMRLKKRRHKLDAIRAMTVS